MWMEEEWQAGLMSTREQVSPPPLLTPTPNSINPKIYAPDKLNATRRRIIEIIQEWSY